MIRAWTVALGLALVGCAKTAQLDLSMKNNLEGEASFAPTSVELNHEDDGWIKVSLSNVSDLDGGKKVQVAMQDVPKGTYLGARVGYTTMVESAPEEDSGEINKTIKRKSGDKADGGDAKADEKADDGEIEKTIKRAGPKMEKKEGTVSSDAAFCVTKKDGAVTFVVKQGNGGDVKLKVNAPEC